MKKNSIILFFLFSFIYAFPQASIKDSNIFVSLFSASYTLQLPGGDMAKRFGLNSNIGGAFSLKDKKNFFYGAEFNFLFGSKLKEDNIFDSISTDIGFIIDGSGEPAEIYLFERGFYLGAKFGKVFKGFGPNPNSGFLLTMSPGFLQHKIRIENPNSSAYQLRGDYKKGYDRLTNGFALNEFVGYLYLGNKRLVSFIIGFDFTQGFTQSRRYDFDKKKRDTSSRFDLLYGFKVCWLIPMYKRAPDKYYY
ncbi:MAG: hypothetical protein PHD97_00155 [Bacteroidales bacterium]|nr:hypothetical protein [Bacteroidales bacterium]